MQPQRYLPTRAKSRPILGYEFPLSKLTAGNLRVIRRLLGARKAFFAIFFLGKGVRSEGRGIERIGIGRSGGKGRGEASKGDKKGTEQFLSSKSSSRRSKSIIIPSTSPTLPLLWLVDRRSLLSRAPIDRVFLIGAEVGFSPRRSAHAQARHRAVCQGRLKTLGFANFRSMFFSG